MKKVVSLGLIAVFVLALCSCDSTERIYIVPPNKPCQKSRSIFSVVRIEKGTDLVRI